MPPDNAGVIAPPPLIYLAGIGGGFVLDALLPSAHVSTAVRTAAGVPLLVVGGALMAAFVRALSRARTAIHPGHATTAVVTSGPYRLTRNPGYLGMALVGAGVAVTTGALWVLAGVAAAAAVVDRGVIVREERYLARTFGDEYRRYTARVRRWM